MLEASEAKYKIEVSKMIYYELTLIIIDIKKGDTPINNAMYFWGQQIKHFASC